jgi:hypothetical protein
MKVAKRTAQAFASMVVLSLLMSGSVFAFSTRFSHLSSSAAPLAADNPSKTTTATNDAGNDNSQVTRTTHTNEGEQGEHLLQFKLVAVTGAVGKGDAEVQIRGNDVRVLIQVEQAVQNAPYKVDLVVSSTPIFGVGSQFCGGTLGTFMTSNEGQDEVKLSMILSTGTPFLGLVLCTGGTPALVSDPLTRQATITPATTTESETEETNQVSTKQEDKQEQDEIKSAEDSKVIPAVVSVSGSDSALTQLDPKFSVSVSRPGDNRLSVSISGVNGTGPRVLLINVSKDAGGLSNLGSLSVTYDGNKISEASSLSQVFNGTSASPPSFLVLDTASGVQLLVFIPHFSSHLVELLASPASLSAFSAEVPLLLAGIVAVAALSAAVYTRRKRFTPTVSL